MKLLRISSAVNLGLIILASLRAESALAQSGVMAFREACAQGASTELLFAMRGDGSGRIPLPLPPLPLATDRYGTAMVLDVTTSGPTTVIYFVSIGRDNMLVDFGLFAVQLDEVAGVLTPQSPVPLRLPAIAGVDPNIALHGSFSSVGSGDRLALVASSASTRVLMTAKVDRDSNSKIIGLSDLVEVGDLFSIGIPDPKFPTRAGITGFIDYSPNGKSIVASIYYDLWLIHLRDDNTYLSAERLTENTSGFAEWNPAFSPDGGHIAYVRAAIGKNSGLRDLDIYSLVPATHAVQQVTSNSNKGSASRDRNDPMWSPDGAWIAFTAGVNSRTPRGSTCPANHDIFLIKADGSTTAAQITNTNTSVEYWPKWGW